ncbi:TonB-dependent receptor [Serratia marcescens]|uniref:TonB-dependent receptor n=1 Tax=Serratia marcescens TaxID=615 RepID=UPI000E8676BF|nr:TonB-dependent receptor [Serratia marcescens]BBO60988.1 vibriobactin receptor [Serratia marcescens]HAU97139.1 TonB-dependent receptor [Serratia marcescens]
MGKHFAAQRHESVGNGEKAGLKAIGAFSSVFLGVCSLAIGNVNAAETKSNETYKDAETLLVTGEKVKRSIFDTGSSVEVFDSNRISSMPNATQVPDLLRMTPNVVDVGIGNDLPTVRGVDGSGPTTGAGAFLSGTRPRLNLSLDGRSLTYNEQAYGPQSLWDLDRVEVFRGPQSYIQGRNAIAGAIVMASKDPTFEWESAFKGGAGNQHSSQLAAMASGPLVEDQLAFRVSVDRQRRRSDADLPAYEPVGDPREVEATTARAKLLFNPAGLRDLTTKLTFNHFGSTAPQNESLNPQPHPASARHDIRRPVFKSNVNSGIWDLAWEASDGLALENRVIYTDFNINRATAYQLPYADIGGKEVHVEPVVRFGGADSRLHGLAGLRYFHAKQDEFVNIFGGATFKDKTDTNSAFAELTYALTPQVDVTAASRLEREHRQRNGGSKAVRIDFDETYTVFLPKLDVAWKPTDTQTYGAKIARGYNAGGAGITLSSPIVSYTYGSEYVWNYELYTRHHLKDANVVLTSNVFYNDYKDMQLPYYLGENSSVIRNADKVETYGAEIGATWQPRWDFELFGNVGLLKTKIKKFSGSGVEGHELGRAPAYTANMGAKYQFLKGWEVSTNVAFSDSYYSAYDNDSRGRIGSYWSANAQLAYTFAYGRATLFAQNLFDSERRIMVGGNDIYTATQQRPRMVGAAVELNF